MRYMIIHQTNAHWEAGAKPTPELIQKVGGMIGGMIAAGVLKGGEGLGPSSQGVRVRISGGKPTAAPGPFSGGNPFPARYALFRAADAKEAGERAGRFGAVFGDVTVDVRPVNEAWDLGLVPKPADLADRRYMAVVNADAASESGAPLRPDQKAALTEFADGLPPGAFLGIGHFEPGSKAKRLVAAPGKAGKPILRDGPFTETKELIGGFVIVEVPGIDQAVEWAARYLADVETGAVDVRGLADPA